MSRVFKSISSTILIGLVSSVSFASEVSIPNTFLPNTAAKASEVNENFTVLQDAVNDNHTRTSALESKQANMAISCQEGYAITSVGADGNLTCSALNAINVVSNTTQSDLYILNSWTELMSTTLTVPSSGWIKVTFDSLAGLDQARIVQLRLYMNDTELIPGTWRYNNNPSSSILYKNLYNQGTIQVDSAGMYKFSVYYMANGHWVIFDRNMIVEFFPAKLAQDTDGDGLFDEDEINIHLTDPANADSDFDGLNDGEEINTYSTDPNDADSDDDTAPDGAEILGSDSIPNTGDETNPNDADSDDDGLMDGEELLVHYTDPNSADTDGGGASDGQEVNIDFTDPLDPNDDL